MPITKSKTDLFISKIVKRDGDLKDRSVYERHLAFDITAVGYDQNIMIHAKSDTEIDVDALRINIEGNIKTSLDVTINTATTGANALDTGVLVKSTWYYIWAINGPDTAGLLSASSTDPVMPSGYTLKRLIGYARTDGTADLLYSYQFMNEFIWDVPINVTTTVSDGDWSGAIPCSAAIPSRVRIGIFGLWAQVGTHFSSKISIRPHESTWSTQSSNAITLSSNDGDHSGGIGGQRRCMLDSSQQINHMEDTSGDPAVDTCRIDVEGFICGLF